MHYAWPIEQSIRDCKITLGVGQARNRPKPAVERTVPLQMPCLTILFCWYPATPQATTGLQAYRREHPWHRHKTHASVDDMPIAFRRDRFRHNTAAHSDTSQFPDAQATGLLSAA